MRARDFKTTQFAKLRIAIVLVGMFSVLWCWDDIRDWFTGAPRESLLLFTSAASHDLGGIDRALSQGADINARSAIDTTAIFYACDNGDDAMVKALLNRGANPNVDAQHLLTPLGNAVGSGSARCVGELLAAGADPNVLLGNSTVLDTAEARNDRNMAALLREHGAKRGVELRAGA